MKYYLKAISFIIVLLFYSVGFAQKQSIEYNDQTHEIIVDGKPYAIMIKTNAVVTGLNKNFSIQSLTGTELIFFKLESETVYNENLKKMVTRGYYNIHFLGSGIKVKKDKTYSEKGVMKEVVNNNLIKDNALDSVAERRYIQLNR